MPASQVSTIYFLEYLIRLKAARYDLTFVCMGSQLYSWINTTQTQIQYFRMFILQILMLVCIAQFCSAVPTMISTAALTMNPSAKATPPAKVSVSPKPTVKPTAMPTAKASPPPKMSMKPTAAKASETFKPSFKATVKK